jgi:hypothetical protein
MPSTRLSHPSKTNIMVSATSTVHLVCAQNQTPLSKYTSEDGARSTTTPVQSQMTLVDLLNPEKEEVCGWCSALFQLLAIKLQKYAHIAMHSRWGEEGGYYK